MSSFEKVQEYYERGLKAAREGRFMAADHFFQRAVSGAYNLHGFEGRVQAARHIARIYKDQGLARMAARHYRRALSMLVREGARDSGVYSIIVARLEELNRGSLSNVLKGLGIISPGNGPVTGLEIHAPDVLEEVRRICSNGPPSEDDCELVAYRLNRSDIPTGKGGEWTARHIRDLCDASLR